MALHLKLTISEIDKKLSSPNPFYFHFDYAF